jgi:hypothetical protein
MMVYKSYSEASAQTHLGSSSRAAFACPEAHHAENTCALHALQQLL